MDFLQPPLVAHHEVERRYQDAEVSSEEFALANGPPTVFVSIVYDFFHVRQPSIELCHPIVPKGTDNNKKLNMEITTSGQTKDVRHWCDNQERSVDFLRLHQVGDQRYGLNRFSQTLQKYISLSDCERI